MRRFCSLFVFFLFFLLLHGCGEQEGNSGVNGGGKVVEMDVEGSVYNVNPNSSIYGDVYGNSSIDAVFSDMENGDAYATYVIGVLYFNDYPEYDIDQDFSKGLELLKKSWEMGVVDAGYDLFEVYSQGNGVEKNSEIALYYLQESAEKGYLKSQRELARDYFGRGLFHYLDTDYEKAREWYAKAASQGDRESAVALAKIYDEGLGVEKNEETAFEWASRSEDMPYGANSIVFNALAYCYEEGVGTDVDLVNAYKYYDLLGTAGGSYKSKIAEKMTPEQIDQAVRLSGEWQREHNISMPNSEGYRYR
ncbi:tetratricopeptide repeat protein [Halomonas huangheensis]|nr:tetratricopeptide repeat protein [Halomonas huangheensis]